MKTLFALAALFCALVSEAQVPSGTPSKLSYSGKYSCFDSTVGKSFAIALSTVLPAVPAPQYYYRIVITTGFQSDTRFGSNADILSIDYDIGYELDPVDANSFQLKLLSRVSGNKEIFKGICHPLMGSYDLGPLL